jgi:hypothetical protein
VNEKRVCRPIFMCGRPYLRICRSTVFSETCHRSASSALVRRRSASFGTVMGRLGRSAGKLLGHPAEPEDAEARVRRVRIRPPRAGRAGGSVRRADREAIHQRRRCSCTTVPDGRKKMWGSAQSWPAKSLSDQRGFRAAERCGEDYIIILRSIGKRKRQVTMRLLSDIARTTPGLR